MNWGAVPFGVYVVGWLVLLVAAMSYNVASAIAGAMLVWTGRQGMREEK